MQQGLQKQLADRTHLQHELKRSVETLMHRFSGREPKSMHAETSPCKISCMVSIKQDPHVLKTMENFVRRRGGREPRQE